MAKDLQDIIFGDEFTNLVYAGSIDLSSGSFPTGIKGGMYKIAVGGTVNSVEYSAGAYVVYDGAEWQVLQGSGSGSGGGINLTEWNVTPSFTDYVPTTAYSETNATLSNGFFSTTLPASGQFASSIVFDSPYNMGNSDGQFFKLDGLVSPFVLNDIQGAYIMGLTDSPDTIDADLGIVIAQSGTVTANILTMMSFKHFDFSNVNIEQGALINQAPVAGVNKNIGSFSSKVQLRAHVSDVEDGTNRKLKTVYRLLDGDEEREFIYTENLDISRPSGTTLYPFVAFVATDVTAWPFPTRDMTLNLGLDDSKVRLYQTPNTVSAGLLQFNLDAFTGGEVYFSLGTPSFYEQVTELPASASAGDLLLAVIDENYEGPTPTPLNGEKVYNDRLIQVLPNDEIEQIKEVLSFKGEWDVTPQYSAGSTISSFNEILSENAAWDDATKTVTFNGLTATLEPAYTVLDRTIAAENTAFALEFDNLTDNFSGEYFMVGLTDDPSTLKQDLISILSSSPPSNNVVLCVVGDPMASGDLTIQSLASGPLNPSPTVVSATIPFNEVQVGDRIGFYFGASPTLANTLTLMPVKDFAAGYDLFNGGGTGTATTAQFATAPNVFVCNVATSDVSLINGDVKHFTFSYPDIIPAPSITGTTAEGMGITQEQLDSARTGDYYPLDTIGPNLVYTIQSPDGFQPGDEYVIKNDLHENYPVSISGVSVAPGDLVKTLSQTQIVNITNSESFDEVSNIVTQVSSPFSNTLYVSSVYEGPIETYFTSLYDACEFAASDSKYKVIKVLDETLVIDTSLEHVITGKTLDLTNVRRINFNFENGYVATRAIFISESPTSTTHGNGDVGQATWVKFPEDFSIGIRATDNSGSFDETVFPNVAMFGLLSNSNNSGNNPPTLRLTGWVPPGDPNYDRYQSGIDGNQDPRYSEYAGPSILFACLTSTNIGNTTHKVIFDGAYLNPSYDSSYKPEMYFADIQDASYSLWVTAVNGTTIKWDGDNVSSSYAGFSVSPIQGPGNLNIYNYSCDVVLQTEAGSWAGSRIASLGENSTNEGGRKNALIHIERLVDDEGDGITDILDDFQQQIDDTSFKDNWIQTTSNGPSVTVQGLYSQYYVLNDAGVTGIWTTVDPGTDESKTPSSTYLQTAWQNSFDSDQSDYGNVYKWVLNNSSHTLKFKAWNGVTEDYQTTVWTTVAPGEWYTVLRDGESLYFYDFLVGASDSPNTVIKESLDHAVDYLEDLVEKESAGSWKDSLEDVFRVMYADGGAINVTTGNLAVGQLNILDDHPSDNSTVSLLYFNNENDIRNLTAFDDFNDNENFVKQNRTIIYNRSSSSRTFSWIDIDGNNKQATVPGNSVRVGVLVRRYDGDLSNFVGTADIKFDVLTSAGADNVLPDVYHFTGHGGISDEGVFLSGKGLTLNSYLENQTFIQYSNDVLTSDDIGSAPFGVTIQTGANGSNLQTHDGVDLGRKTEINCYDISNGYNGLHGGGDTDAGHVLEEVWLNTRIDDDAEIADVGADVYSYKKLNDLTYRLNSRTTTQNISVGPHSLRGVRQFNNMTISHTQVFSLDLNAVGNANGNDSRDFSSFIFGDDVTIRTSNDSDNINHPVVYWHKYESAIEQQLTFFVGKNFRVSSPNATTADYVPFVIDGPASPISAELRIIGTDVQIGANVFKGNANVTIVCDNLNSYISRNQPNLNGTLRVIYTQSASSLTLNASTTKKISESIDIVANIYNEDDLLPFFDSNYDILDSINSLTLYIRDDIEFTKEFNFTNVNMPKISLIGKYDTIRPEYRDTYFGGNARPTLSISDGSYEGSTNILFSYAYLENIKIDNSVNSSGYKLFFDFTRYTGNATYERIAPEGHFYKIGNNVSFVSNDTDVVDIDIHGLINGTSCTLLIGENFTSTGGAAIRCTGSNSASIDIRFAGYANTDNGWLWKGNITTNVYAGSNDSVFGLLGSSNSASPIVWPDQKMYTDITGDVVIDYSNTSIRYMKTIDSTDQTLTFGNASGGFGGLLPGVTYEILHYGSGNLTLTSVSGASFNAVGYTSGTIASAGQYSIIKLTHIGSGEFIVSGDIVVS